MKHLQIVSLLLVLMSSGFSQTPKKSEIVSLKGTNVYYEVYGKGDPLLLLHGYTQSSKSWLPFISDYMNDYEIYLIDLKGHGKSGPFKEKLSIKSAASDVEALIKHLNLKGVNAIGYSYGGDILFQLAVLDPALVKSMITIGSCGIWNAKDFPDWIEFVSYKNINNLKWMSDQQTGEAQSKAILDQFPNYNAYISEEELKAIQAKTLIILGDQDNSISLDCVKQVIKNLVNSFLWILPNTNHGAHEGKNKNEFVRISKEFFNSQWKK